MDPGEEGNEATLRGHVGNEELRHPQPGTGEQSWEQRFKSLQQELSCVKKVVRGRAPDTMDTLVQHTESPFTADVRPEKFQFLEKGQNSNFGYKFLISVKNLKFILWISDDKMDFTVGIVSRSLASTSNFVEFRDNRNLHIFRGIAFRVP